jgi:dolichyl-diphosphooligosaccharide--protein glycosyltransferase
MRREIVAVTFIAAAAFAIRVYPAWHGVFGAGDVRFLETDAWYHVRLVENQVRNFPWRTTLDPFAADEGQFVPIAPLYDTVTAAAVVAIHGRDAVTADVARVAAFTPPVFGTLAVVVAWAVGRRLVNTPAGVTAAALLATSPGHFMDRTMLGFVDHHALESLLALAILLAFTVAIGTPLAQHSSPPSTPGTPGTPRILGTLGAPGALLGLYLLTWGSGSFLLAILGTWLAVLSIAVGPRDFQRAATITAIAALVALGLVLIFQDARMQRYDSQIVGLVGLTAMGAWSIVSARLRERTVWRVPAAVTLMSGAVGALIAIAWLRPSFVARLATDVWRLVPDSQRMAVLEARPLFLYTGEWSWEQPWLFFRTGFYVALVALLPLAVRAWRARSPALWLLWVFTGFTLAATIGQNRFGYYFVPAIALSGGWLAARAWEWASPPSSRSMRRARGPGKREIVIVVAAASFAPLVAPSVLLATRTSSLANHWAGTLQWLREHTPPPFTGDVSGDDYYLARYPRDAVRTADYTIMNWWDHGYWITQLARRVPVANPTQARAWQAARFYTETDEDRAMNLLQQARARYVVADWELPFRVTSDGTVMGRFQSVVDWAGGVHASYYEVYYERANDGWRPVWVYHEPYYRSMAFRLTVLGAAAGVPDGATTVMAVAARMSENGMPFTEIQARRTYPTYAAATRAAAESSVDTVIVGLDPWRPAFPIEALSSIVQVHETRTADQPPSSTPWERVFEVR